MIEPKIFEITTTEIFSRGWYNVNNWETEKMHLMSNVDDARQTISELIYKVEEMKKGGIISNSHYSPLRVHLDWLFNSIGVFKTYLERNGKVITATETHTSAAVWQLYSDKIYPNGEVKLDWDNNVLGKAEKENWKNKGFCIVMPSVETIKWLNQINNWITSSL